MEIAINVETYTQSSYFSLLRSHHGKGMG